MSDRDVSHHPVILARHGARAHVDPNTMEAFRLAGRLGADGLALDAWRLDAGPVVVATSPTVRRGLRRRAINTLEPGDLPPDVVLLADVLAIVPPPATILVTANDTGTAAAIIDAARDHPVELWLAADDPVAGEPVRARPPSVKLLARSRLVRLRDGPERHAATLAASGIDGVVLPCLDWTGGLTALFHRFELLAVADDAQHERIIAELARMGIDGIVTDWPDRAVDVLARR
jgi:glycerophosphoryl diester phosphodiesterase